MIEKHLLLNLKEVSFQSGFSQKRLRELIKAGKVKYFDMDGKPMFSQIHLQQLIDTIINNEN